MYFNKESLFNFNLEQEILMEMNVLLSERLIADERRTFMLSHKA